MPKTLWKSFVLALLLTFPVLPVKAEENPGWKQISFSNGIAVYKRKEPDSRIFAMKGESVINAPIGRVAAVMDQVEHQTQWVPYLGEAKQLKIISFYERIIYTNNDSPWPAKDRDFLMHSILEVDRKAKKITVTLKSFEDPIMPVRKDRIRGNMARCVIVLESLDNGMKTYFSIEVHVDPKGWIPKWLVNLVQRKWTRKYIEGLKMQMNRPEIKKIEVTKEFPDQPFFIKIKAGR
jgi:hypothetical protein